MICLAGRKSRQPDNANQICDEMFSVDFGSTEKSLGSPLIPESFRQLFT